MLSFESANLMRIVLYYYHPATPDVLIRRKFIDIDSFNSFVNDKRNQNKCVRSYTFEYECKPYDFSDVLSESQLF